MHRMTGLAAAIAAAVTLGIGIGWMLSPKEQTPTAPEAAVAERELVTGTVASRANTAAPPQPQAAQPQSLTPPAAPAPQARPTPAMMAPAQAKAAAGARCRIPTRSASPARW